jgi:hypothetical protein
MNTTESTLNSLTASGPSVYDLFDHLSPAECELLISTAESIHGRSLSSDEVWKILTETDHIRYQASRLEEVLSGKPTSISLIYDADGDREITFSDMSTYEAAIAYREAGAYNAQRVAAGHS